MSRIRTETPPAPHRPAAARQTPGRAGPPGRPARTNPPKGEDRRRALEHVRRGVAFLATGEEKAAWTQFTRAVETDPDCAEACFEMGRYQHERGNLTAAARWYQRALTVEGRGGRRLPRSAREAIRNARVGRGVVAWQKKAWKDALEHLVRATSEGPVPSDFLRHVIAECRLRLGRAREAVDEFRKAPWRAEGLMTFGLAWFAVGEIDRAAATLRRAFFHHPGAAEDLLGMPADRDGGPRAEGPGDASRPRRHIPAAPGGRYAERCRDLWEETQGALDFLSALWTDPQVASEMKRAREIGRALDAAGEGPDRSLLMKRLDRLRSTVRIHNSQTLLLERLRRRLR